MKPFKIILASVALLILLYVPYVGLALRALNTMIHETGHAFMTLLTSGKVNSISLFANTEGVTESMLPSWFSSVLVSLSGYVFSSLALLLLVYLWKKEYYKSILYIMGGLAILNLLLWVRNGYGVMWLIAFIALSAVIMYYKKQPILIYATFAFLLILGVDGLRASNDILYLSVTSATQAGDATNLASKTFIPAFVWGLFFWIQQMVASVFAIRLLIKKK